MRAEIEWRRLDQPAVERAAIVSDGEMHVLSGVVEGTVDGLAYRMSYLVRCAADWTTRHAKIAGTIGGAEVGMLIERDAATGEWTLDGAARRHVHGCIDVDLGFSPITNTLPIRRLGLHVGQSAAVRAAWVRFPDLAFDVLQQRYERVGQSAYRYESDGGRFRAELDVDASGIVVRYDRYWVGTVR